jgi:hypothetical protein
MEKWRDCSRWRVDDIYHTHRIRLRYRIKRFVDTCRSAGNRSRSRRERDAKKNEMVDMIRRINRNVEHLVTSAQPILLLQEGTRTSSS